MSNKKEEKEVIEQKAEEEEDYDEDEDEDFDPSKETGQEVSDDDDDDDEPQPDYSNLNNGEVSERLIKTRNQRLQESNEDQYRKDYAVLHSDLQTSVDIDALFSDMQKQSDLRQTTLVEDESNEHDVEVGVFGKKQTKSVASKDGLEPNMITIRTSYVFAGKLVNEEKQVDANSAEAKAYMNSTKVTNNEVPLEKASSVAIIREVNGETMDLRIKLKRPSLIDKLLTSANGKFKLSTLEKSRLDWASYVDRNKIKDDLAIHNKAGYLDRQDFLSRVEMKRDDQYKHAQDQSRIQMMNQNK